MAKAKRETMPKCPFCESLMHGVKQPCKWFLECTNYADCWFQGPFRSTRAAAIAAVRSIRVAKQPEGKGGKK